MTAEEIVKAARDAGFSSSEMHQRLVEFKRLIDAAAAAEREQCAKVCDESAIRLFSGKSRVNQVDRHTAEVLRRHAEAIRARGNQHIADSAQ